ncbi:MAG TPA: YqhR family membrane protein [Cerasibacillus sp.]|uniref:YqhR family membrane protein n=1 Tax=Cerasibacillus sp. TaxID=2498711 RepID=UPI002F3FBA50
MGNSIRNNTINHTLSTGFIGGMFWSMIWLIVYVFNFTVVSPKAFLLRSWLKVEWTETFLGDVITILLSGLVSIGLAFLYYIFLKKSQSILAGIFYGIALWAIAFYILKPVFPQNPSLDELPFDTIVTTLCLFIIYGIFIGYTISYDYEQAKH